MNMLPKVILHNSISLDGSLLGFDVNMEVHYGIAGRFGAGAVLAGSNTVLKGFEIFGAPPPETEADMKRPDGKEHLPFIFVPDSTGRLQGVLHGVRGAGYFKDAIVLVSESTPPSYLSYLERREYRYHVLGEDKVDLEQALHLVHDDYGADTVLVDTGSVLGNLLLNRGLVSEVSLLVHPVIVGKGGHPMFGPSLAPRGLKLQRTERLDGGLVWTVYVPEGGS